MTNKYIYSFALFLLSGILLEAQKIKNLPEPFWAPIAHDTKMERDNFAIIGGAGKKGEFWMVAGDRESVALLDKPNGSQTSQFIKFKETAFVIDESGEWIKIGMGSKEDNKFRNLAKSGWVKKTEVLLWPKSLRDKESKITKKGFLLNKLDKAADITKIDAKKVKIYDGPNSTKEIGERDIYNVYFMYKEDNNRILLGGADFINQSEAKNVLIGWVDESRIEKWNQRLTLECDWEDPAFTARKNNDNRRIYGFADQSSADHYTKTGNLTREKILWDNDPAKKNYPKSLRSDENNRRPVGDIFRFPVFGVTSGYYQSGAVNKIPTRKPDGNPTGMIPEDVLIEMKKQFDSKIKPKRDNFNVVFLIEGSAKMANYKAGILAAIETLDFGLPSGVNIKYGAGIYRDENLSKNGWDFSYKALTKDRKSVVEFVNSTSFNDYTDLDPVTNQRYAISQILNKGNFRAEDNNLLIVIGACADFYYDNLRRETAETSKSKQLIDEDGLVDIYAKLTQYDMNLAFMQIERQAGKAYSKYAEDARSLIVNAAQKQYAGYKNVTKYIPEVAVKVPDMPDLEEGETIQLSHGVGFGMIKRPERGSYFSQKNVGDFIKLVGEKSVERTSKLHDYMKKLIDGGGVPADTIDEEFSAMVLDFISKLSPEAQKKILDEKIRLYRELFLPVSISEIKEPYKYVIFMPEIELEEYVSQLRDLKRAMNGPDDIIREQLRNTVVALILKMTGDKMSYKEIDNMDIAQFMGWFIGINMEGLKVDLKGISIKDILDKKKLSAEALQKWASDLTSKEQNLSGIVRNRGGYPYSYKVGDSVYFWLEMSLLDWSSSF